MKRSTVQLTDLPDEILLMIFMKVNNVQLLYSLIDIDTRLDRIISDPIFTKNLALLRNLSTRLICPLDHTVLDRFCLQILPQIHYKIITLNMESLSMERILLAADYPNLDTLGLYNVDRKTAERVFADKSPLIRIFNEKIQSLVIIMTVNDERTFEEDFETSTFVTVLNVFKNLHYLNCLSSADLDLRRFSFHETTLTFFFSSTLLELHINVDSLNDCLYLLDGRLNQLRTFHVDIGFFPPPSEMINNKKPLPTMKCFSLTSKIEIIFYNKSVVELVQRMMNLEKLSLYISVGQAPFIDGKHLKTNIINHLPYLKKFIVNIRSFIHQPDHTNLLSNKELQHSLTDVVDSRIVSYIDYFSSMNSAQCHFYSYPYTLRYYHYITCSFSGGLFECVREVSLFDDRPFEHYFFLRIAQAFPLMEKLSMINRTPQNQKANTQHENLTIIQYAHLIELNFHDISDDYLEQFLATSKTHLLNNVSVYANYEALKRVTNNFTSNTTRVNSGKIRSLRTSSPFQISQRLIKYFPHATISFRSGF